jgi:hypothetical protein
MKTEQVRKEIEEKWEEIVNIFKQNYNVNEYKIKTQKDQNKLYQIYILKKSKRKTSTQFVIKLKKDGKEYIWDSRNRKGAKTLVSFILKVGVEDVYNLNISAKRVGFLMTDNIDGKDLKNYELIDGKYIFKKSENEEKMAQIQEIINKLNLDASIVKVS